MAGAVAIVTASQDAKLERSLTFGADYVINYQREDPFAKVMAITGGRGVDLVFDVVGGESFTKSLPCLARSGRLLSIGAHSQEIVPLDLVDFFFRHISIISSHTQTREELKQIFRFIADGRLTPVIYRSFPLEEARAAHELMERREHYGKIILHPWD
jgi:NADPH:quinone reductase-like Zn-dependent oxidoreductase